MKVYDREELEQMKRVDIQRICKCYGVKANLKTEALIELLLDMFNNTNLRPLGDSPPPPQEAKSKRALTRSRTNSLAASMPSRNASIRSVTIHDDNGENYNAGVPQGSSKQSLGPAAASRTAKAKETQRRLGVGRPVTVGGLGARVSTKKINSRTAHSKGRKTISLLEETIEEEDLTAHTSGQNDTQPRIDSVGGDVQLDEEHEENTNVPSVEAVHHNTAILIMSDDMRRMQQLQESQTQELLCLKTELSNAKQEILSLHNEIARLDGLESEFREWRELLKSVRTLHTSQGSTSPKVARSEPLQPTLTYRVTTSTYTSSAKENISVGIAGPSSSNSTLARQPFGRTSPGAPSPSISTLGKRHRDSTSSSMTGNIDAETLEQVSPGSLTQRIMKPEKKRVRLDDEELNTDEFVTHQVSRSPEETIHSDKRRTPTNQSPPPLEHLPEFFETSLRDIDFRDYAVSRKSVTTPSGSLDKQLDFDLIAPTTSTPCVTQRTDVFDPTHLALSPREGVSTRERSPIFGTATDKKYLNPNALFTSPEKSMTEGEERLRMDTRKEVNPALRPRSPVCVQVLDTPARPMQKTLYGTEAEVDKRFGDFGRDGVATAPPFWIGGKF